MLWMALFFFASLTASEYCAFCDEEVLQRGVFYEDDCVRVLYTHRPIVPAHFLVIPKRHVERFEGLSTEEIAHMGVAIQKLHQSAAKVFSTSSYILLQKNGQEAGQTVPHVHFHYIARDSNSVLTFAAQSYIANLFSPISQEKMEAMVCTMQEAMGN